MPSENQYGQNQNGQNQNGPNQNGPNQNGSNQNGQNQSAQKQNAHFKPLKIQLFFSLGLKSRFDPRPIALCINILFPTFSTEPPGLDNQANSKFNAPLQCITNTSIGAKFTFV